MEDSTLMSLTEHMSDTELTDLLLSIYRDGSLRERRRERLDKSFLSRVRTIVSLIPHASNGRLVDFGIGDLFLPIYKELGYKTVVGVTKLPVDNQVAEPHHLDLTGLDFILLHADLDIDQIDLQNESMDIVCCFEIIEHLALDPMHCMAEANRILRRGGMLAVSTPNAVSWQCCYKMILGKCPHFWSDYSPNRLHSSMRHHREYTPLELEALTRDAGFEPSVFLTRDIKPLTFCRVLAKWAINPLLSVSRRGRAYSGSNTYVDFRTL
jgi:2-polyprenyl-3-methyl-5-hydroxy-6-metoxy-1,4-benzoquinol methylase